jgi:CRISPR-associated protein Csx10
MKKKMLLIIETVQPVLISVNTGSQNHWETLDYFPGSAIRGTLANLWQRKMKLGKKAHEDADFYDLFLSGKLRFLNGNLFKENQRLHPLPMNIEVEKTSAAIYRDSFETIWDKNTPAAKYKAMWALPGTGAYKVEKSIFFHTTRKDKRMEGKAGDGGVFTYSAIERGQQFASEIIGEENDLILLKQKLGDSFSAWFGRSKTAQYGQVKLSFSEIHDVEIPKIEEKSNLLFAGAALFNNGDGFPVTDFEAILQSISRETGVSLNMEMVGTIARGENQSPVKNMKLRTMVSELYYRHWDMKRPSHSVISPASVIQMKLPADSATKFVQYCLENGLGENCVEGFGEVAFISYSPKNLDKLKQKSALEKPTTMDNSTREILNETMRYNLLKQIAMSTQNTEIRGHNNLPNSLGSRIISQLKAANSYPDFQRRIEEMTQNLEDGKRKSYKKSGLTLQKIHINKIRLSELLLDYKVTEIAPMLFENEQIKAYLKHTKELREMSGLNSFENDFIWKAFQTYLETLLIQIRKTNRANN